MGFKQFFESARRRSAARKYALQLGPRLRRDYGAGTSHTADQIRTAAQKLQLPMEYLPIGYAAFMNEEEFRHCVDTRAMNDYEALRSLFARYIRTRRISSSSGSLFGEHDVWSGDGHPAD
jgi:hypothetical protein